MSRFYRKPFFRVCLCMPESERYTESERASERFRTREVEQKIKLAQSCKLNIKVRVQILKVFFIIARFSIFICFFAFQAHLIFLCDNLYRFFLFLSTVSHRFHNFKLCALHASEATYYFSSIKTHESLFSRV